MTDQSDPSLAFHTRSRILSAAEHLFAERGLDDVNLREITDLARVNLASVSYHFGSRHGLMLSVFDRVAERANRERLAELNAYLEGLGEETNPQIEDLISIFLSAYIGQGVEKQGRILAWFMLKSRLEPLEGFSEVVERHFDPWTDAIVSALEKACPHLSHAEVYWRYFFMTATITMVITERKENNRIQRISDGEIDVSNSAMLRQSLSRYLISSFERVR
ncbi:TetR family transcriptional regulator [Pseudooceanicola sp. 216_PA32_1]|uniref:TetR family transcriptional regulator n=1 Tax=Pseudooceanicola pacificus TaxID=2676438 RepID=A0A844WFJ5_9RHOB|nr:TetR/AcrR family transcriptional regulator [Pseudooceanicola pacificus]MWB78279.1 TetR family transcriptional regulator [Pseudooceanicola pacificus]